MTNLERRYRALLRMLPQWYREAREQEMVTTLLAGRRVRWALAMAIVAWAVLPDRLNFLTFAQRLKTFDGVSTPFTVAMIRLIGLAAVSIPLTFLGIRRYRQLPRSTLTAPGT